MTVRLAISVALICVTCTHVLADEKADEDGAHRYIENRFEKVYWGKHLNYTEYAQIVVAAMNGAPGIEAYAAKVAQEISGFGLSIAVEDVRDSVGRDCARLGPRRQNIYR